MRYLILSVCFFLAFCAQAQRPGNSDWSTESEFRSEEPKIIKNIQWLEENPVATPVNDTKAISEYILSWLAKVPYLEVTMDYTLLSGIVDNDNFKYGEKFRVTYLFGKSFYYIEHQENANEEEAIYRGTIAMVKVYRELKKYDPAMKNKPLAKYSKLQESGKLRAYVQNRIAEIEAIVE